MFKDALETITTAIALITLLIGMAFAYKMVNDPLPYHKFTNRVVMENVK